MYPFLSRCTFNCNISTAHPEGRQMGRHWLGESVGLIGTVLILGNLKYLIGIIQWIILRISIDGVNFPFQQNFSLKSNENGQNGQR